MTPPLTDREQAKERLTQLADHVERKGYFPAVSSGDKWAADLRLLLSRTDEAELWRPISEHDGSSDPVDVWGEGDRYCDAYWIKKRTKAGGEWWAPNQGYDGDYGVIGAKITHFRPLPSPPKVSDDGR